MADLLPALTLPTVCILVRSALVAAGLRSWLLAAGLTLGDPGDPASGDHWPEVWIVDDHALDDLGVLDGAPAAVSLGSPEWAGVLSELPLTGWAALPTDASPAEVLAGVLGAAAGLAALPAAQVSLLALADPDADADADPGASDDPAEPGTGRFGLGDVTLTPRELDVLRLLTEGLSNKRVARDLGISESTVKFHAQAVYGKLGVQSRAAAVTRGLQLGLISL